MAKITEMEGGADAVATAVAALNPAAVAALKAADEAFTKGDFEATIKACEEGIKAGATANGPMAFCHAAAYHKKGEAGDKESFKKAAELYAQLTKLPEKSMKLMGHQNRAVCLMNTGAFEEASKDLDAALALDPENEETKAIRTSLEPVLKGLGAKTSIEAAEVAFKAGKFDEAIKLCSTVLEGDPKCQPALFRRAVTYAKRASSLDTKEGEPMSEAMARDVDAAIADYSLLAEVTNSSVFEVFLNRATLYLNKGEMGKALEDVNKVLEIDPENAYAKEFKGTLEAALGENAAINEVKGELAAAEAAYEAADYEKCIALCTKVLEVRPESQQAYFRRAVAHHKVADKGKGPSGPASDPSVDHAIKDYTKVLELTGGKQYQIFLNRATVYLIKHEFALAMADVETALGLAPDDARAKEMRSVIAAAMVTSKVSSKISEGDKAYEGGDYTKAIELFTTALTEAGGPEEYNLTDSAGMDKPVASEAKQACLFKRALAYTKRADTNTTVAPGSPGSGGDEAVPDMGDVEASIKDFTAVLSMNPGIREAYCNRGFAYVKKGEVTKAVADIEKAVSMKPDDEQMGKLLKDLRTIAVTAGTKDLAGNAASPTKKPSTPRTPGLLKKPMGTWTTADVCAMVEGEGIEVFRDMIKTKKITGEELLVLTVEKIKMWGGVETEDAQSLFDAVQKYKGTQAVKA